MALGACRSNRFEISDGVKRTVTRLRVLPLRAYYLISVLGGWRYHRWDYDYGARRRASVGLGGGPCARWGLQGVEQVAELVALGLEVAQVLRVAFDLDGYTLDKAEAIALQTDDLLGVVGQ